MGGIEAGGVSIKGVERVGIVEMDGFEGLLQLSPEISGCGSPDDAGQNGLRALFDQDPAFSDFQGVQRLSPWRIEGVLNEGLNGGQHAGHELLIMNDGGVRCDVMEKESGVAMNEEELFNAESQRVEEDHFCEGASRAPGLNSPGEPFGGKAVIERLIEGLHQPLQGAPG